MLLHLNFPRIRFCLSTPSIDRGICEKNVDEAEQLFDGAQADPDYLDEPTEPGRTMWAPPIKQPNNKKTCTSPVQRLLH